MRYQVSITINGITSDIDTIEAPQGYTAEEYIEDCRRNADDEWNDMLETGMIELWEIEE